MNSGSDKLDSRISYTRSSTGTAFSAERHKSSENLVTQSDGSDWTFSSSEFTKTASQAAPDGSTNGTKFAEKAAGSRSYIVTSNSCVPTVNQEITFAVWLKQTSGSRDYQQLRVGGIGSGKAFATFNLSNGTVDETGGTLGVSASVNAGPTGWYQCILKFTPTATTAITINLAPASASGGELPSITGDTANSVTLFGAIVSNCGTVLNETSGQIHREFAPTLKTSAADAPRFEYSAADGQSVGLLIEAQSSNLLTYSEDWTNSDFTKFVAITSNAGIAPTGELAADLVTATSSTGDHLTRQSLTVVSGQTYTMSVFAKASGCNFVRIGAASTAAMPAQASFNLANGTVGTVDYGTAEIEQVGNGFYRCSVTGTAASNSSTHFQVRLMQSDNTPSWTGDDYSGVLLFGQMAEHSSSVSSYIKTTSSSVSRASDSCSVDLNGILASGQDVTLYAEGDWGDYTVKPYNRFLAALSENTDPNWIALYNANSSGASYVKYLNNLEAVQTGVAANGNQKSAVSVAMNSINHAAAGVASAEDTSATVPPYTQLNIGNNRDAGTHSLNGHCTRVALYGQALSSSELAALTS